MWFSFRNLIPAVGIRGPHTTRPLPKPTPEEQDNDIRCLHIMMRFLVVSAALMLTSCARLERNSGEMTTGQMLQQSTHVFIGVILKHEFPNRLLFRISGEDAASWRVIRMKIRVEMVVRGTEPRAVIDVYEAFPTGGVTGDWNSTHDHRRYLFLVRVENGRYHVVRDFRRSIFPVHSGHHSRLPLDDSRPFWERFALLQWWVQPDRGPAFGQTMYADPDWAFGMWRLAKVLRGLLRHPDSDVRLAACEDLFAFEMAQDECWNTMTSKEQQSLNRFRSLIPAQDTWKQNRRFEKGAHQDWEWRLVAARRSSIALDELRLFTTINNPQLRQEFCRLFQRRFPQDRENGCPADRPPPATIVTQEGDIPLTGEWPKP